MKTMKKPNILFIMTDQLRWDAMGCTGDWVKTPSLDKIASEGILFSNCVTNSPVCIPARVSLATGLYPHNTGIWNNFKHDMPGDTDTWMQAVRDAGYRTSLFGKTHLHHHQGDLRDREYLVRAYGMDDIDEIGGPRASARVLSHMTEVWENAGLWDDYKNDYKDRFSTKPHVVRPSTLPLEHYADVYVGQQAKKYLESYKRDQPWFCWVSFGGPHEPWDTPEPYASMYKPEDMPLPYREFSTSSEAPAGFLSERLSKHNSHHPENLTETDIAAVRADYAGNVTLIDAQVGEILDAVEKRGELDNTVIVFSSDHGEMNGDHGLIYKGNFLNGSVRIPLILRTPETLNSSLSGSVSDSPVELFDVGPTLAELAGAEIKHQQFARSLCPLLKDIKADHRDYAVSEIYSEIMIMTRKWKMVLNKEGIPYLLFDIEHDPNETDNIVMEDSQKEVVTELRLLIQEHLVRNQQILQEY